MKDFWYLSRYMLQYRRMIALSLGAAVLDALCAFSGFGALMWVINTLMNEQTSLQAIVESKLRAEWFVELIGDPAPLLAKLPTDQFISFVWLLAGIALLTVVGSVFRFAHQYWAITACYRAVTQIRKTVFRRLVHVAMASISMERTGDLLSRLVRDSSRLARGFMAIFGKAVRNILVGTACLLMAFWVDWMLTGIFVVTLPLIAVLIYRFGRRIRHATRRALKGYGTMTNALEESLQANKIVKLYQAEGYERRRFNTINRRVLAAEMKARMARAISAPVVETLGILGVIAVALMAGSYVFQSPNEHSPADLVGVLTMLCVSGMSIRPLANLNNELQEAGAGATRVCELLQMTIEPNAPGHENQRAQRLPRHHQSICFDQVEFTYPAVEQPALKGIDLEVPFGVMCAIVGSNGSGKSTLMGLLPRLYEPSQGRILIDGHDIATYSLRSVRQQLAVVTQDSVLFDGTIGDNLTYGQRHVTRRQMIEAARRAHADTFIEALPLGYDTAIGEWGGRLSGGQRQRIVLARAILRDPAILILDEATSQIDAESETQINKTLSHFHQGRTTFIIAHRLSTVIGADMIVVMEDGLIVDHGTHDELIDRCGTYRILTRTQFVAEPKRLKTVS